MNSSVAQPEMKGRGAAKQGMKSATGPAEKAMPGEAAKKPNAGEGSMHKASAGKQPATAQGKTGEQGRRATNAMAPSCDSQTMSDRINRERKIHAPS
jgi:hypothetical protein